MATVQVFIDFSTANNVYLSDSQSFIKKSDHNAYRSGACTGNVEVTTTPLETKPREGCRKHTGPADCDPKGHGGLAPKGKSRD